jgi:hypothetical protein
MPKAQAARLFDVSLSSVKRYARTNTDDRGAGVPVALPAELLSGSQSHRGSVLEDQEARAQGLKARTKEALIETIGSALSAVSSGEAHRFFEHRSYRMPVQSL